MIMKSYIHKEMDTEVRYISGYYNYLEELRLNAGGREVLCAVGVAILDNSCCGRGGCYFIEVPGYIVAWKKEVDEKGHAVSDVMPVESEEEKKQIRVELQKLYPQAQVNFV